MLTNNFSEIINSVKQKLETNTINILGTEEIGNVNLMLRGYVGLIQNGFKTPDDSKHPPEQYSTRLIGLLSQLTPIQEQNLKHQKETLLDDLMAELNALFQRIDSMPQITKAAARAKIKKLRETQEMLYKRVGKYINDPTQGSMEIIRIAFDLSNQMKKQLAQLKLESKVDELASCEEQLALVTTFYLKQMTQIHTLELDNQHCITFVTINQLGLI